MTRACTFATHAGKIATVKRPAAELSTGSKVGRMRPTRPCSAGGCATSALCRQLFQLLRQQVSHLADGLGLPDDFADSDGPRLFHILVANIARGQQYGNIRADL